MLGTIVWDQYASGTYGKLRPHYKEYNDIDDIIDNLTYLQNMLYNPNFIIVEFNGNIYNATNFGTTKARKDNAILYEQLYSYRKKIPEERIANVIPKWCEPGEPLYEFLAEQIRKKYGNSGVIFCPYLPNVVPKI